MSSTASPRTVERWDLIELDVTEVHAAEATFSHSGRWAVAEPVTVGGRRLIRFAPDLLGSWEYTATGPDGGSLGTGSFECVAAEGEDPGPAGVRGTRFTHADGAAHHPLGTTALWWHEQDAEARAGSLATLARSPFSAVRMSVLARGATTWPEPAELEDVESAVVALRDTGFQAELVLFDAEGLAPGHPGWTEHLLQVVHRFAAYRNVWWCLALDADRAHVDAATWDEALRLVAEADHGRRPRTVHAGPRFDFGRRLISHSSVRDDAQWEAIDPVRAFGKPALLDVGTEGDLPTPTGGRTAEDLVSLAWWALVRGGYFWHAEEFARHSWSRHGGNLSGESAPRLEFLAGVLASAPADLTRDPGESKTFTLSRPGQYYLQYHGLHRYSTHGFSVPHDAEFAVELLDTWNMTVERVPGTFSGEFVLDLPRKPYLAVRVTRC
ncbi:DUF5605 domain-containing protein [Ruania alba]|uniref:DUF5605 domain-containing protein n=1 Tax=Ruania alba TaxID=648782 RepID=A0A1H5LED8_9MICO|nr:DUF5605 domain-containing protein [Ruania alba]SEE75354.1 hypothetical protein SAMN04488554_2764 [Ruania alba]